MNGTISNQAKYKNAEASSEITIIRKKNKWQQSLLKLALPLGAGILFVIAWQFQMFHSLLGLRTYQLPLPNTISEAIKENASTLLSYTGYTLSGAVAGLLLGSLFGFVVALIASIFPRWGLPGLTLTASLNAVPIVALAPIMNLWFGDGMGSRIAVVSIVTMGAMAINSYKGLVGVDPLSMDLMKTYAADKLQMFRYLRLPNSLPYLLTALKINTTASMIGVIVSEFFYSSRGLGYLLSNSIKIANMSLGWACIVFASIVGILFYLLAEQIERALLHWDTSQRQ